MYSYIKHIDQEFYWLQKVPYKTSVDAILEPVSNGGFIGLTLKIRESKTTNLVHLRLAIKNANKGYAFRNMQNT